MSTQNPARSNQDLVKAGIARRVLARRRLLQYIRLTYPQYMPGWVHDDICRRLEKFSQDVVDGKSPRLMLLMPPRHGKQLAHDTLVPTPEGMRRHGDIQPGDYVYHPSGRPISVLAVSAEAPQNCEVEFFDGTVVQCHENHEWTVYDRAASTWRTVETGYLFHQQLTSGKKPRARFQLPPISAVHGAPQLLPIDPYFLGVWLGDGASSEPRICGCDTDMKHIVSLVPYERGARHIHPQTGVVYQNFVGGIRKLLRENKLLNNKHIPEIYFLSSVAQRLKLLEGLVDTDGNVEPRTQCVRFRSGSKRLIDDVAALVRSLGYRASIDYTPTDTRERHIVGGESWCVQWTPHDGRGGGTLLRKVVTRTRERRAIGIKQVRRGPVITGKCLQVDSPDGLYLVTENYVPTHNSEIASIRFPSWHLGQYPHHEIINVGYNMDLPMKFSRKVREIMREPVFHNLFPDAKLNPDSQSVEAWNTTSGGGYTAAGVGGGITGKGAHILIVDDPIKNQEEADSIITRDKLWDWYQSTAYTRLAPGGGVLCIECMTGETPVLLCDGTEQRLDAVRVGDTVATYENGRLTSARVAGWKHSGRDSVLKITMTSGRIVRANGRHPFLVSIDGRLAWIRARSLTTAHTIVALPDNGASGKARHALPTDAKNPPSVAATATRTTTKNAGLTGTAHRLLTQSLVALRTSSIDMASQLLSMTSSMLRKTANALSAGNIRKKKLRITGAVGSASTTATTQELCGRFSATTATSPSDIFEPSALHSPWLNTSEFIAEQIASIEPDGEEDVYDLQVDRTENFIANGLVTHNTWWHDDDLAGRLLNAMRLSPEADQFEVVKYPALSEAWEYRDPTSLEIFREQEELPPQELQTRGLELLRPKDFCLHEERYPTEALKRIRANLQPRIWSALYQQNPVPDEGMYFRKEFFRFQHTMPNPFGYRVVTAWDFAIGEKQQNDWTVGATLIQDENDILYVVDIHRLKGDSFQIIEAMLDITERWMAASNGNYLMGAEDGQIWRSIEPMLKKRMVERKIFPSYEVLRPLTDKLARARPLQGRMQQGRVVFPEDASWVPQAAQEMLRFPAGAHDDVVDALAWAVRLCIALDPIKPGRGGANNIKSWKEKLGQYVSSGGDGSHMAA